MIPLIVFGAIVAAPVLLAMVFRVNAVYIFLGICAGYLLQMALSDSVDLALAAIIHGSNSVVAARAGLMAIPIILTLFLLRKTQGKSFLLQIIPLIFSGMLLGSLLLPLLSPGFSQSVYGSTYGGSIRQSSDLITAVAVVSNLVLAWTLFKPKGHGKHH
jgi:hypothetical protein